MKRILSTALLGMAGLVLSWPMQGRGAVATDTTEIDFRNIFSYAAPAPTPPGPPAPATANQFDSGTAFSGFVSTRIVIGGVVVAGGVSDVAGPTSFVWPGYVPRDANGAPVSVLDPNGVPVPVPGVRLMEAAIGQPITAGEATYLLGSIIPPPEEKADGTAAPAGYYFSRPQQPGDSGADPDVPRDFYYSPNADKVFAIQAGVIKINWVVVATGAVVTKQYVVSVSPVKPVRKIYWTELGYNGPTVQIPAGLVSTVNIVYNNEVPKTVTTPVPPKDQSTVPGSDPKFDENRTIWYDSTSRAIHAYNKTGRVFVEYLGNLKSNVLGSPRTFLGFEIVEIVQEITPVAVTTELGEVVRSPDGDASLHPAIIAGLNVDGGSPFLYQHVHGGLEQTLYAIRATAAVAAATGGALQPVSNEVLIYWEEAGELGIYWPKNYAGYIFEWPSPATADGAAKYSQYVREEGSASLAKTTGVQLSTDYRPTLVYQSDRGNSSVPHAVLGSDGLFYTNVSSTFPQGYSLIRYTNGDDVWFERVWSRVDTSIGDYSSLISARVGDRIEPPASILPTDGSADDVEKLVGFIREASGNAYDVTAYRNPFVVGFEEAAKGAIIGVNALPTNNVLEVWWYKKSRPAVATIQGTYWPQYVRRYQLSWPANPPKIVLADNLGSGALDGDQTQGTIYYQNDSAQPGFNPNEEHALMSGGRAWALRDDLNVADSSEPYVLLSYKTGGRPAMRVFKVQREDVPAGKVFRYPATAGTVLQSPMPLAVMPPPNGPTGASANVEVVPATPADPPLNVDPADHDHDHYKKFTFEDRKGIHWIYRGPNNPADPPATPLSFSMLYKYKTQPGFYFPHRATQPAVGTIVPYLRPYKDPAHPEQGFAGDELAGPPLPVVFEPRWPASVPELRVAETLTVPKVGLPAVRGQTSASLLYQQSIALNMKAKHASAVIYDPTRNKTFALKLDGDLGELPKSLKTSVLQGKTYFPNLPPHLSERFYFDPTMGTFGSLVLKGQFVDAPVGEKYLLPNILSEEDMRDIKGIVDEHDAVKEEWDEVVERGLKTRMETFYEDPHRKGTFIVNPALNKDFGPGQLAEVTSDNQAVDSYAVAGIGGGAGYVVMITGNGINTDVTPTADPVALQVFKIGAPLVRGELKVLTSSNPLAEKVTLQHSNDFAGHPEEYEFDWRYARAGTDPLPPIYTIEAENLLDASAWTLVRNPGENFTAFRDPSVTVTGEPVTFGLPIVINDGKGAPENGTTRPHAVVRRTFTAPAERPLRLFVSLSLNTYDGAVVYINNVEAAAWHAPGHTDSVRISSPGPDFKPLSYLFEIKPEAMKSGAVNAITVELYTTADAGAESVVNARLEAAKETDKVVDNSTWQQVDGTPAEGKMRHVIEGTSVLTLTDNYFVMRYRAVAANNAAHEDDDSHGKRGWSKWTEPQLAEGWIKRALGGINPFNQRITDLYNNAVDTQVSLITQSGKPWEGDVALNLENIDRFGLIEIYETILRRGRGLSIDGTPPLGDTGANNALLLASGYLSDLYTILGNEAFADAANPTISVGSDGEINDFTTSLFAFKGQLASVLEEELALLRGRDDFLSPGTQTAPVYNRLFWNFTRGIAAGEPVYVANYDIKDENDDGKIDAADAATMYPQGHGDAYGHYLSALTGFYGLLHNEKFSWTPRTEDVLVAGIAVRVGYQDERKFALAAAALARTASQVVDLTYRQSYTAVAGNSWGYLRDGGYQSDGITNPQKPNRTRHWGVDEWASRGGQGAFFNWVTANSVLPSVDQYENHYSIQKVDRTTVTELGEIAANAETIQRSLDNADARLNPLGLSAGAQAFDISPSEVDAGRTHFEQVYSRAVTTLGNAVDAFKNARDSARRLRQQSDNADSQRLAIEEQEQAYTNRLIEIYGTPYADDIGVGRTYVQGYAGPDLLHYAYIDLPSLYLGEPAEETTISFPLSLEFLDDNSAVLKPDLLGGFGTITINERGDAQKPSSFTGKRSSPGRLQTALSEVFMARQNLFETAESYSKTREKMGKKIDLYLSTVSTHNALRQKQVEADDAIRSLQILKATSETVEAEFKFAVEAREHIAHTIETSIPTVMGLAADSLSYVRGTGAGILVTALQVLQAATLPIIAAKASAEAEIERLEAKVELDKEDITWTNENRQLLAELRESLQEHLEQLTTVNTAIARLNQAERDYDTIVAEGDRIQNERATFRKRAAAITQGYRTNDYLFRAFRDEALEKYRTLFELAAKYTYLAAKSYDYETGLLDASGGSAAAAFFNKVVQARSPGVVSGGQPQFGGSETGDPGLAGVLAKMNADWSVAKTRLGFNNPDRYKTTFSLRREKYRLLDDADGDTAWQNVLKAARRTNILDDPDVRRHVLPAGNGNAAVPGLVIEFGSTIQIGSNFFLNPLAGGDHTFSPSSFSTKIRSSGIAFKGYPGMDAPTTTSGALSSIGATSPADPAAAVASSAALNATPYVYLIPCGTDVMSAPPIGGQSLLRSWSVEDQAIPLPFNIGGTPYASDAAFVAGNSLSESVLNLRRHQPFRAVPDGTNFSSDPSFTNSRLIGRSVWNTRWKLVIPGNTLLASPQQGLDVFIDSVTDIKLHFETYSYSGN